MNVGSLFTGIGGFDLGLERAGFTVAWQCEQDEFCRRVLAKHWPGVPCYPDVRTIAADNVVEPVDVLCGGFPCQDLSYAGKGAGIDGARSGLWAEYARLVGELRPRYVVVENVAALLRRGLGRVLGDLAALGYDAEWDCIPASAFGAPHRRDRLWLIAYPGGDDGRSRGARRLTPGGSGQPEPERPLQVADTDNAGRGERRGTVAVPPKRASPERSREVADAECERCLGRSDESGRSPSAGPHAEPEGTGVGWGRQWLTEPDVGRMAHGVPARVDRLRSLGNSLVPQIAEWLGRRILEHEMTA